MEVELMNKAEVLASLLRCGAAASVCVNGHPKSKEEYLKSLSAAITSGHNSVLEHCTLTFSIRGISRACSHQLVRHRLASYSQQSQRYVNMDDFEYVVPKSIRAEVYDMVMVEYEGEEECAEYAFFDIMRRISALYKELIKNGVPKEDARYILPNACCTDLVMTMNMREFIHICNLRLCVRAQWEIRELVNRMRDEVLDAVPSILDSYLVPQCEALGYCQETRGCGRYPGIVALGEAYWAEYENNGNEDMEDEPSGGKLEIDDLRRR